MSFHIINNLLPNSHGNTIHSLIKKSDEVIIASPFLFPNFKILLKDISWNDHKKIHLVTTLKENSEEQFKKIRSLKSLIDHTEKKSIECRISIDNSLHGKVYIFVKEGIYHAAIVSSANFTHSGLYAAREWGVLMHDEAEIAKLHTEILQNLDYENVIHDDIRNMYSKAEAFLKKNTPAKPKKIALKLTSQISGMPAMKLTKNLNYYLKPIGHSGDHINRNAKFDKKKELLHFAKEEPRDIQIGDILIAFAVGSGRIISVYRILKSPQYTKPSDRWPWFVQAENLTPNYGGEWWKKNLTKENLKVNYDIRFPGKGIKPKGKSQGFGAFQFGWDRLLITQDFGKYIISEVLKR